MSQELDNNNAEYTDCVDKRDVYRLPPEPPRSKLWRDTLDNIDFQAAAHEAGFDPHGESPESRAFRAGWVARENLVHRAINRDIPWDARVED